MMVNQAHTTLLRQGATVWNAWQELHPDLLPDFNRADLSGTSLGIVNLSGIPFNALSFHNLCVSTSAYRAGLDLVMFACLVLHQWISTSSP